MAEVISLASGLVALTTFAFQSTVTLLNTVQSIQLNSQPLRNVEEELEALSGVLASLVETASTTNRIDLSALHVPLLRSGHSCQEFEREIMKWTSRSGGSWTDFQGDVDGFRDLLAGYNSTINIALTTAIP